MTIQEINESYGFNVVTATTEQIGQRAIELCNEYADQYPENSTEYHKLHTIDSDVLTKLITKNQHTISKKVSLWNSDISISDNILRVRTYVKDVMKHFEVWLSEYTGEFLVLEVKRHNNPVTGIPITEI